MQGHLRTETIALIRIPYAVVTLLLAIIGTCCLWFLSYSYSGWISLDKTWDINDSHLAVVATQADFARGGIDIFFTIMSSHDPEDRERYPSSDRHLNLRRSIGNPKELFSPFIRRTYFGFAIYSNYSQTSTTANATLDVRFPFWSIPLTVGVLAALLKTRFRCRRESGYMLCTRCGYDLRASKDRCPECGAAYKAVDPSGRR